MNIAKFWHDTIDNFNAINKCGFCWGFGAPLTKSGINMSDPEKCCVNVFFTDHSFETIYEKNNFGYNAIACDQSFNLWIMTPTDLGVNNYNEIDNHLISESHWQTIFLPIYECLGCNFNADFCRTLGYSIDIIKWKGTQVVDSKFDNNYKGYMIQGTFRQNI